MPALMEGNSRHQGIFEYYSGRELHLSVEEPHKLRLLQIHPATGC